MKWIEFSRLMQAVEYQTPTKTVTLLTKALCNLDDSSSYTTFIKILTLDLEPNNLASKKAMKWLTKSLGVFESELEYTIYNHGDISEGIYHFDSIDKSSQYNITNILSILQMDCGKSDGESFRRFNHAFHDMSSLERKWFIRYWLRTPRNGVNEGTIKKVIARTWGSEKIDSNLIVGLNSNEIRDIKKKEIKRVKASLEEHAKLHSLSSIVNYYMEGKEPPNTLSIGRFIKPMLAHVVPKNEWPKESIIEYKYDGARYQIHKGPTKMFDGEHYFDELTVLIYNRKGKVVTDKFPDVVEEVISWEILEPFIIDTEIYPVDMNGLPSLMNKMGTRIHSKNIEEAVEKCPVNVAVFDCMMYENLNLMKNSLRERLQFINKFPKQAIRTSKDEDVFYNLAINDGFEGIMIKDLNAAYESGKRSKSWAKHKPPRFDFDVVVTGARYGEGKRANVFGSFDIAVKKDNVFYPVGSVGTGFSDIDLMHLTNQGKKIIQRVNNETYEFLPRIVLEVTCDLVTRDADGNVGLRFPRMVRIRDDKPVSEINTHSDILSAGSW